MFGLLPFFRLIQVKKSGFIVVLIAGCSVVGVGVVVVVVGAGLSGDKLIKKISSYVL